MNSRVARNSGWSEEKTQRFRVHFPARDYGRAPSGCAVELVAGPTPGGEDLGAHVGPYNREGIAAVVELLDLPDQPLDPGIEIEPSHAIIRVAFPERARRIRRKLRRRVFGHRDRIPRERRAVAIHQYAALARIDALGRPMAERVHKENGVAGIHVNFDCSFHAVYARALSDTALCRLVGDAGGFACGYPG